MTMISSLIYKSDLMMVNKILRMLPMMSCEIFLQDQLSNTRSVDMLENGWGEVGGLGESL